LPQKTIFLIALVAVFLLSLKAPSLAQTPADLARVEKQLEEQKAAAQGLEKKETATAQELETLRDKLITAGQELQTKSNEQEELEDRLTALEKETERRTLSLNESRRRLALLTRLLLQFSRQPSEVVLMQEASPDDPIHRTILLRSMLPHLKDETNQLAQEVEQYTQLQNQTEKQRNLVKAAGQNLSWQKNKLDQLIQTRQGYLEKTTEEKEALTRQLESLTNEAKDLRQLMEKVTDSSWSKAIGKSRLSPSSRAKAGLIKMPVSGKVVHGYGDKDDFGVTSEGITFAAAAGSPVIAPRAGRVMFAGAFRGYGKVIILQHEGGYHSFLSGFARLDVDVGQQVESGEPLGILPTKGQGKAELYFEWRHDSKPLAPV
jgi:septal ring factor EnvC (AmiA/AmiB activator)